MKKIETKNGKLLVIKVSKDMKYYEWKDILPKFISFEEGACLESPHFPIGKLSELTDEDCKKFVELTNSGLYKSYIWNNFKIKETGIQSLCYSAKQSFISLLQSKGIDVTKEWLIIKIL